jgi:hypothetical protein
MAHPLMGRIRKILDKKGRPANRRRRYNLPMTGACGEQKNRKEANVFRATFVPMNGSAERKIDFDI